MALDAPTDRDEVFDEQGIVVVVSRQDLARIGDFRVDVLGDVLVAWAAPGA